MAVIDIMLISNLAAVYSEAACFTPWLLSLSSCRLIFLHPGLFELVLITSDAPDFKVLNDSRERAVFSGRSNSSVFSDPLFFFSPPYTISFFDRVAWFPVKHRTSLELFVTPP